MSQPYRVRRAQRADALALAALHLQDDLELGATPQPGFLDRFAQVWLDSYDHRVAWLAEAPDGRPLGVISVVRVRKLPSLRRPDEQWWHVSLLFVTQDARGEGIGEALMTAMLEGAACEPERIQRVQLNSVDDAVGFYGRHGFSAPRPGLLEHLIG